MDRDGEQRVGGPRQLASLQRQPHSAQRREYAYPFSTLQPHLVGSLAPEAPVLIATSKASRPNVSISSPTPYVVQSLQIADGLLNLFGGASLTVLGDVTVAGILYLRKDAQLTVKGAFYAAAGVVALDSAVVQVGAKTTFDTVRR